MMKMYIGKGLENVLYRPHEDKKKSDKLDCHQCEHHYYDTLFGGDDEYELCEKNHELHPDECEDFKEV